MRKCKNIREEGGKEKKINTALVTMSTARSRGTHRICQTDGFACVKLLQKNMINGTLLRSILVVLLSASCCGKPKCNYREILGSYREVIFIELQNLNLNASFNESKKRDPCPSAKAHRILASIYGLSQQIRCQRSGKQLSDLERPVENMEQLIFQNCSPNYMTNGGSCSAVRQIRGKKRKRLRLIEVIKMLINCWAKLQSVYASVAVKTA